jgi:trimethylamine--corrinoid protein Co-methyltransferase
VPGLERVGLRGTYLGFLAGDEVERIHAGALQILARTGVIVHDDAIVAMLHGAGSTVDGRCRVTIPDEVVEKALAQAPPVVTLYNRFGEVAMSLGAGTLHARSSSGATGILDLDSGRRREPTSTDAADAARLADALPCVHGVSAMTVQPADLPLATVDVHSLALALANTVKPLGYVCLNEHLLELALAMAAAVVGGDEALRRRPILTALAESTSPLQLVASQLAVVRAFASRALPLTLHAHPIAGLTAPVTLSGELVVTHAEVLALATIAELIQPGTPIIYGLSSSVPDMRRGTNLSGAVEIGLLGAGVALLATRCGLPCVMSSGSDAHRPGAQSILERLMTLLPPALAGVDLINLTTLETKMTLSLEQLVIDDMVLGMVGRLLQGIRVDSESLALDLIQAVGPQGDFLARSHTLAHFRDELLVPGLLTRESRESWEMAGLPDLRSRARERVRAILREHRPPPLADGVSAQIEEILEAAQAHSWEVHASEC